MKMQTQMHMQMEQIKNINKDACNYENDESNNRVQDSVGEKT